MTQPPIVVGMNWPNSQPVDTPPLPDHFAQIAEGCSMLRFDAHLDRRDADDWIAASRAAQLAPLVHINCERGTIDVARLVDFAVGVVTRNALPYVELFNEPSIGPGGVPKIAPDVYAEAYCALRRALSPAVQILFTPEMRGRDRKRDACLFGIRSKDGTARPCPSSSKRSTREKSWSKRSGLAFRCSAGMRWSAKQTVGSGSLPQTGPRNRRSRN
jgi:hypothetical protein